MLCACLLWQSSLLVSRTACAFCAPGTASAQIPAVLMQRACWTSDRPVILIKTIRRQSWHSRGCVKRRDSVQIKGSPTSGRELEPSSRLGRCVKGPFCRGAGSTSSCLARYSAQRLRHHSRASVKPAHENPGKPMKQYTAGQESARAKERGRKAQRGKRHIAPSLYLRQGEAAGRAGISAKCTNSASDSALSLQGFIRCDTGNCTTTSLMERI